MGTEENELGGAIGKFQWTSRWMTKEEAEARGMPVPERAGLPVLDTDAPGILQPSGEKSNLLVTTGLAQCVLLMGSGLSGTKWSAIAVGSSATPAPVTTTETALAIELTTGGWARTVADAITAETTTLTNDTLQLVKAFTLTGTPGSVEEIGIFNNNSTGGAMLCRALTGTITLPAGTVVTFTYKVKWASA